VILYVTSLCRSVRCLDLAREAFTELFVCSEQREQTWLACDAGNSAFTADNKGYVNHLDLRGFSSKGVLTATSTWHLHDKKISSVHVHPREEHMLATASNDGTVCMWDVRRLDAKSPKSTQSLEFGRAVSSAFFSPCGGHLLTTSYDDTIRIYTVTSPTSTDLWQSRTLRHNNQTGRWITKFRAVWGPRGECFAVGHMGRQVAYISFISVCLGIGNNFYFLFLGGFVCERSAQNGQSSACSL
jgi:hypothetical protein